MDFEIRNCNNIDIGSIQIAKGKLNIKFGVNGTGKSTIAKAIKYSIEAPEKLTELLPFKLRKMETELVPQVEKSEEISSVFIFNEEYLNQFLYKQDELISNSFEIFIKTPNYLSSLEKIEELLIGIKNVFTLNAELNQIIKDFESLSNSFVITKSGISKKSAIYKGLEDGNKIEHIPEHLKGYSTFLKNSSCTSWLDWQIKGEAFVDISDDCPYCTSSTAEKKETIKSVAKFYDKNVIKNFSAIIEAIKNLGDYFSDDTKSTLDTITKKHSGLEDSEINFLLSVKQQIDDFLQKLKDLRDISPKSFKDDENVRDKITNLKIDINLFDRFKSEKSVTIINSLNNSLNKVLAKIGLLQGEVSIQKQQTKKLIEQHQYEINSFLENAGYKYVVEITDEQSEEYKLRLRHIESIEKISGGNQHLSFGEKNAFALVLFMYEALSKNPDLIILDDPISSFDKNKKYAIMHMLFRMDVCLKNRSVLMLTHDLEPVIDTVKVLQEFHNLTDAKFLSSKNGILSEKAITRNNILTFSQICNNVLLTDVDEIIKLIYLRRKLETIDDKGDGYQVLSNLFHKRTQAECRDFRKDLEDDLMDNATFISGVELIIEFIPTFNYEATLIKISNDEVVKNIYGLTENGYIKLQLFRLLYENSLKGKDSILQKFVNETYHIENELICQLDPIEFDLIPSSIIEKCNIHILNH
jgi:ABC-type Mn2+/Zn2+ transport system ATPase subunit